jgi:hypothetical protein
MRFAWPLEGLLVLRPLAAPAGLALGVGVAASAAVLFTDAVAQGKASLDSPYGYERTWNAALRLVRVDLGLKVLENDDKNGYLLFEYRSSDTQKPTNGSFEVIRSGSSARPDDVRVVVQLTQMPTSHEQVLLDHLARKMREEYGAPPEPRTAPPPPPPDAGPAGPEGNDEEDNNN